MPAKSISWCHLILMKKCHCIIRAIPWEFWDEVFSLNIWGHFIQQCKIATDLVMSSQEVKRSSEVLAGLVFDTSQTYMIRSENLKNLFGNFFFPFYSHSDSIFICVTKLKLIKGNVYTTLILYNQGHNQLQNNFEFPQSVCFSPSLFSF